MFEAELNEILQEIRAAREELRAEIRTEFTKVRVQTLVWTFGLAVALFAALAAFLK